MRKLIVLLAVSVMAVSFSTQVKAEKLTIVGTGSGMVLLRSVGHAFTLENPDITIVVPDSIGSGGGIRAVGNGEYLLGRVARDIKDKEKKYDLIQVPFAKMPIVFFVNRSVPLSNISPDRACRIYEGSLRKWQDVFEAGKGKIRVIRREDGDSSLSVLKKCLFCFENIILTSRSKMTFTDPETIKEGENQKNSIGFAAWPDVKGKKGIHALSLNGIAPNDPAYPCTGILSFVYKEKNYKGSLKKFIDFFSTSSGKKAILDAGSLPVE